MDSEVLTVISAEVPDAPLTLSNVPSITSGYQIGLTWTEGAYNGGSPVLDYRVSYKAASETDYLIFASNIAGTQVTVTGLMPGVTY